MRENKITHLELIFATLLSFVLGFVLCGMMQGKAGDNVINIDLPEEYNEISKDSSAPTNLQGYWSRDTLFIQFKN